MRACLNGAPLLTFNVITSSFQRRAEQKKLSKVTCQKNLIKNYV
jgi:hypothetical protein